MTSSRCCRLIAARHPAGYGRSGPKRDPGTGLGIVSCKPRVPDLHSLATPRAPRGDLDPQHRCNRLPLLPRRPGLELAKANSVQARSKVARAVGASPSCEISPAAAYSWEYDLALRESVWGPPWKGIRCLLARGGLRGAMPASHPETIEPRPPALHVTGRLHALSVPRTWVSLACSSPRVTGTPPSRPSPRSQRAPRLATDEPPGRSRCRRWRRYLGPALSTCHEPSRLGRTSGGQFVLDASTGGSWRAYLGRARCGTLWGGGGRGGRRSTRRSHAGPRSPRHRVPRLTSPARAATAASASRQRADALAPYTRCSNARRTWCFDLLLAHGSGWRDAFPVHAAIGGDRARPGRNDPSARTGSRPQSIASAFAAAGSITSPAPNRKRRH